MFHQRDHAMRGPFVFYKKVLHRFLGYY